MDKTDNISAHMRPKIQLGRNSVNKLTRHWHCLKRWVIQKINQSDAIKSCGGGGVREAATWNPVVKRTTSGSGRLKPKCKSQIQEQIQGGEDHRCKDPGAETSFPHPQKNKDQHCWRRERREPSTDSGQRLGSPGHLKQLSSCSQWPSPREGFTYPFPGP